MTTATLGDEPLPTPAERPEADVVIYDGACRICTSQMQRLERFDDGRLAFLSLHDAEVARRFPDLEHDDLMRNLVVVDGEGRRHRGADAFAYLAGRLPKLWWLRPMRLPGTAPIWRWLYKHVAARRYLFGRIGGARGCESGECKI